MLQSVFGRLAQTREYSARDWVMTVAIWSGPVSVLAFAFELWQENIRQNIATWLSYTILDMFLAHSGWKAGRDTKLEVLYAIAAGSVAIFTYMSGVWHFGLGEYISLAGVIGAIVTWSWWGPQTATVIGSLAMVGGSMPNLIDSLHTQDTRSWWMWATCSVGAAVCLWFDRKNLEWHKPARWAFVAAAAIFDAVMTLVVTTPWWL